MQAGTRKERTLEQAGRSMGRSTRGKAPDLPPPAMTSARGVGRVGGASTSSGTSGGDKSSAPLSSKNWTVRPVVSKRQSLPATIVPEHETDLPAMWSTSKWGDVRRGRADPSDGRRQRLPVTGTAGAARANPGDDILRRLADKEAELKKKLAAFADFNNTERDLLQRAFATVSREQGGVPGLCTRNEFMEVWDRLGTRLTPALVNAFFAKYGEDRTGRMPVDLFVTAALESRNRVIAKEDRRLGAYKAGETRDYSFSGRIKYFPCRKGVYAPTTWDPALAARSAKPPKEGLSLEWVYGYSGLSNTANNIFYNSADHAVYYTAAVGIVFDRHIHKQYFFHGHDNDIKCMAMHPKMHLVATGQVGSTTGPPIVCIWDTTVDPKKGRIRGLVAQLPFEGAPAVIGLAFSEDGERLTVITNDMDHTVYVFDWEKADRTLGELAGTLKGAPTELEEGVFPGLITVGKGGKGDKFPHVYGASWNPYGSYDKYDELKDEWSEFVTYGAKHIKLWRLHHRDENDAVGFYGKDGKAGVPEFGRFSPTVRPTDIMSVCWLPPRGEDQKNRGGAILASGTREGSILLWTTDKKGLMCVRELEAHDPGPLIPALSGGGWTLNGVRTLVVRDDGETVVSGGGDGQVKWWASAALTGATRSASFKCEPHTTRLLTGDDNKTPPPIRGLDCHRHSSDVMVGTHRCDIWEIDDINGAHPMLYGHSGEVRGLAVHPTEPHIFATGSEAGRLFIWNLKLRMLKAKCNVHHPATGCGFSPDGRHIAVGCKDGTLLILNYKNLINGYFKQVVQREDGTRCEFHHCNEAIDEVKYSPDGCLLAVGSHDNFIDIYDVTGSAVPGRSNGVIYHRLHRLRGHSSYITHIDWSVYDPKVPDRRIIQSTCGAYELLHYDANTGQQVRHSMRDERWDTQTCTLGFTVMGIWPKSKPGERAADGTDINACDRGPVPGRDALGRRNKGELLVTVDDNGKVKLFNYPCVVKHAPYRRMDWRDRPGLARKPAGLCVGYVGHSSHVVNVRFANDGANVISVGGFDRAVFQWKVDEDAVEQRGTTKRRVEPRPYIANDPPPRPIVPRTSQLTAAEGAALADDPEEKCDYIVTVVTGDAKGASTDAAVTFSAAGVKPDGRTTVIRETALDNAPDNFSRGATDVFKIRAADLGTMTHASIGHNNAGDNPGWLLQSVHVLNATKGWEKTLYPQNMWLDEARGGETRVTLHTTREDAEQHAASLLENKTYLISVTTADVKGAGTDAGVWIELFGTSGKSTGARRLESSANNFERGRTDRFEMQLAGLGPGIARARLGHDNGGFGSAWCLEDVSVRTVESGAEVTFDVPTGGVWLEEGSATGTSVDLFPLGPDGKPTLKTITYKVEVHTADVKYAGTDANVHVELIGSSGNSGRRVLSNSRNNFERGVVDVFFLEMPDLGDIAAVKIGHDNAGLGPAWCLDRVVISDESDPGSAIVFPAGAKGKPGGRWLDKGGEGVEVTLSPADPNAGVFYSIEVQTSDIPFAGTDANVSITLMGEKDGVPTRSNSNIELNDSSNNFERGKLETFDIGPTPDLGAITAIEIGHDGSGIGSGWHCDYVEIKDMSKPDVRFHFPIKAWFDAREEPKMTRQTIYAVTNDPEADSTTYKIDVRTSDVDDAGTDANVTITVFGDKGDTGPLRLDNREDNFKRSGGDAFAVSGKNVGAMTHVVVGHDESQLMGDPSWHVAEIRVFNLRTGETLTFPADCWIGKEKPPHYKSSIVLAPAGRDAPAMASYRITVKTSDVRWAGTDAKVSVKLIGSDGKSTDAKLLDNNSNNFERNKEDVFVVSDVNVGPLTGLEVRHDGAGPGSDWHLFSVEVVDMNAPEPTPVYFYHEDWVKENAPVTLVPEATGAAGGKSRYNVVVHTSDKRFAGTDSVVTCKLLGELDGLPMESTMYTLENSANNFERGRIDEFTVEAKNLGEIRGVDVGIDASGLGAAWHVKMISVVRLSDGKESFFHHDDWITSKKPRVRIDSESGARGKLCKYVVEVLTSDVKGSGTDARVSLVIYGDKADTGALALENSADNFERGKKDVFHLEAHDVGAIQRIRIGHDNSGTIFGSASWHCASVEVTNTTTGVAESFVVNRWFAENKPPNQISQVLYPGDAEPDLVRYVITAHTSDQRGAGTDANVTLELQGTLPDGKRVTMGPFALETSADDFKRGASDVFRVEGPRLGDIDTAIVAHDGAGMFGGSDWHLRALEVQVAGEKASTSFVCDAVITKDAPTRLAKASDVGVGERHVYKVTVRTSDDRGSGTDANVWIVVRGELGDTGRRKLDTSADNFQRGGTDVFLLEAPALGEIRGVVVGHDDSGFGPGWKLDDVHVENLNAAKDAPDWHRERFFQHDAWLDSSKAPFQTEVALSPASGGARATRKRVSYTVTVRTSDLRGAGTDATVSLEISGSEAKMGWTRLPDDDGNPFGRGASDEFTFEGVDVGVVEKIAVKHDGRGLGPAWHLASVDVRHNGTGAVTTFPCGDWLSNETCLERSLVPGASSGPGADVDEFRYRVEVVTGEGLTSGTDAKVSIALLAEGLDHPWALDLHQRDETFDAGRVDTFVFGRTDELGPILGVGLRCADAGVFGDSWFVERVSVASLADGREWVFHHGDWVGHGGVMLRDGVMVSAGIANEAASASASAKAAATGASSSGASAISTEYRVTFFTGGEFGAGTDAVVAVELRGANGVSGDLVMDSDPAFFDSKRVDGFNRVAPKDLGELSEIFVWHDGSGRGVFGAAQSGWNLDKVTVEHVTTRRTWEATFDEWIYGSRNKGVARPLVVVDEGLDAIDLHAKAAEARARVDELESRRGSEAKSEAKSEQTGKTTHAPDLTASVQEFKALEAQAIAEAEAEAAAAAAAASVSSAEVAAAAAAGVSDPVSSSSSERTYVVAVDQTGADGNGCPVPVTVRVIGRLADATLVIPTDAVPDARGRIVRELRASNALGPLTQVRVSVAGAQPLGGGQRFEVESVVVDCPPEGTEPAASAFFAARGALDETHPEMRVRRDAAAEEPCEEWEEATAKKQGAEKKYWYSEARNASEWKEPRKYYPVRFKKPKGKTEEA